MSTRRHATPSGTRITLNERVYDNIWCARSDHTQPSPCATHGPDDYLRSTQIRHTASQSEKAVRNMTRASAELLHAPQTAQRRDPTLPTLPGSALRAERRAQTQPHKWQGARTTGPTQTMRYTIAPVAWRWWLRLAQRNSLRKWRACGAHLSCNARRGALPGHEQMARGVGWLAGERNAQRLGNFL